MNLKFAQESDGTIEGEIFEKEEMSQLLYTEDGTHSTTFSGYFFNDSGVDKIFFRKSYGAQSSYVNYRGTVDGKRIIGTWATPDANGPFEIDLSKELTYEQFKKEYLQR